MLVDFCVPVYNEEEILEESINKLYNYLCSRNYSFSWRIVILVNGSDDNSWNIAKSLDNKHKNIKIKNYISAGKGMAILGYWQKSDADIVMYIDADLSASLSGIDRLLYPIINNNYDLSIGTRFYPQSKCERSLLRKFTSYIFILLSKKLLGHNFSDLQCGFKAMKKKSFKKVFPHIKDYGWCFDTELILFSNLLGQKIKEVPTEWNDNYFKRRKSKVNVIRNGIIHIIHILKLRKRLFYWQNEKKI